jgi:hypothetical protein
VRVPPVGVGSAGLLVGERVAVDDGLGEGVAVSVGDNVAVPTVPVAVKEITAVGDCIVGDGDGLPLGVAVGL